MRLSTFYLILPRLPWVISAHAVMSQFQMDQTCWIIVFNTYDLKGGGADWDRKFNKKVTMKQASCLMNRDFAFLCISLTEMSVGGNMLNISVPLWQQHYNNMLIHLFWGMFFLTLLLLCNCSISPPPRIAWLQHSHHFAVTSLSVHVCVCVGNQYGFCSFWENSCQYHSADACFACCIVFGTL